MFLYKRNCTHVWFTRCIVYVACVVYCVALRMWILHVYVRPRVIELSSGQLRDWQMPRGKCGTYALTDQAAIYRAYQGGSILTLWDLRSRQTSAWPRLRPGCWLSTIPAAGMVLSPEAGGGCSCGSWMETSLGFMPERELK